MIRHGARTVDFDTGIAFNDWRLFIDVSSLLLATQLEILEVLDSAVATVIVPQCIQGQLMAFADSLEHPHPKTAEIESTIADALKRVPSAFGRNRTALALMCCPSATVLRYGLWSTTRNPYRTAIVILRLRPS